MNEITEITSELLPYNNVFELQTNSTNVNEDEQEWTTETIGYLLDEVLKKKKELHDPRHRCNKYYGEIRDLLIANRGISYSVRSLEKKFHSLKRTFDLMCLNRDRSDSDAKKPINSTFFNKMMEIFAEELAIEDCPTMASLYPELPLPKSALPQKKEDAVSDSFSEEEQDTTTNNNLEKDTTKETPWDHKAVLDFLSECLQKKDEIWDTTIPRREVFTEISDRLKEQGYVFDHQNLDRKLKNLRHSYEIALRRERLSDKRNRYPWPYFQQLHTLFDGYASRKKNPKNPKRALQRQARKLRKAKQQQEEYLEIMEDELIEMIDDPSSSTTTSINFRKLLPKPDPFQQFNLPAPDVVSQSNFDIETVPNEMFANIIRIPEKCPLSPGDFDCFVEEDEPSMEEQKPESKPNIIIQSEKTSSSSSRAGADAEEYEFAKQMLALEERRTIATEKLLEQLMESNRIRERKLKFNQSKLLHLKTRAKRKHLLTRNEA